MTANRNFVISCVVFLGLVMNCSGRLPSSIRPCSKNTRNIESCIIDEVIKLKPLLAGGNLGDGFQIPPMEPLALDPIFISNSQLNAQFTGLSVRGATAFVVENLNADVPNLSFDFSVFLPQLDFTGYFWLAKNGLQHQGRITGTFRNSRGEIRLSGQRVQRNGVEYVTFNDLDVTAKIGTALFQLPGLGSADEKHSEFKEMIPELEKSLSKSFLKMVNVIMKNVTFDELFPDT